MKKVLVTLVMAASFAYAQHSEPRAGSHEAAGGEAHEQDHGPSPIWKWANFAILAGLIGYGIAKGAGPFFSSRTEQIQKAIREAKAIQADAQARAAAIERRMANLESDIASLKESSSHEMAAEGERIQQETARLTARVQENAQNEIASATNQATKELRAFSAELALELAQQKIRERLNPDVQGSLVDAFVSLLHKSSRKPGGRVN